MIYYGLILYTIYYYVHSYVGVFAVHSYVFLTEKKVKVPSLTWTILRHCFEIDIILMGHTVFLSVFLFSRPTCRHIVYIVLNHFSLLQGHRLMPFYQVKCLSRRELVAIEFVMNAYLQLAFTYHYFFLFCYSDSDSSNVYL